MLKFAVRFACVGLLLALTLVLCACPGKRPEGARKTASVAIEAPEGAASPRGANSLDGGSAAAAVASNESAPSPASVGGEAAAEAAKPMHAEEATDSAGLGVVAGAARLNVRQAPQAGATAILEVIGCGDVIGVQGTAGDDGDWFKVQTARTKVGYVYGSYVIKLHPGSQRPLCQFARVRRPGPDKPEKPEPTEKKGPPIPAVISSNPTPAPVAPDAKPAPEPLAEKKAVGRKEPPPSLPADLLTLDQRGERGKVPFPHNSPAHQAFKCFRCHHPVIGAGEGLKRLDQDPAGSAVNANKNCHSCHSGAVAARVDSHRAFHGTCIDCHRVAGKGKAPTGCGQCHGR